MAGGTISQEAQVLEDHKTGNGQEPNYKPQLTALTLLFFMWGFITCMNDILIPFFKSSFQLSNFQANLVQFAFFGAYFIISLIYYVFSRKYYDPITKFGYKNAIITGLLTSTVGCLLFVPAASYEIFGFFLGALFVLATGVTILQMGANPFVTLLGKPEGASGRLNTTQAFNSLGTTVAPVIGGILLFGASSLSAVNVPYLGLAVVLVIIAVFIKVFPFPKVGGTESSNESETEGKGALGYSHLVFGVFCIFAYVGGEVAIGSNVIQLLIDNHGVPAIEADALLALYWGGAMIGRFYGAIFLSGSKFKPGDYLQIIILILVSFILGVFLINKEYIISGIIGQKEVAGEIIPVAFEWSKVHINEAFIFSGMALFNIVLFVVGKKQAGVTLGIFALFVIILLGLTVSLDSRAGMWSVLSIGLFNSIMFPTIFSLAIKGLGNHTSQGSSLLVMAIVGGAIVPPIQGLVADGLNIQMSFLVPILCYVYIAFYGFVGSKPKNL